MEVSLTEDLDVFVNEMLAEKRYSSESEIVTAGLFLLKEKLKSNEFQIDELKKDILKGYEQSKNGESKPLDIEAIQKNI